MNRELGFEVTLKDDFELALEKTIAALKTEGFGVLTRIDVKATLKEKLGEEFRPYVILGACNPPLAHRSLSADPQVGLMLPCNVTVEAKTDHESVVRIANPEMMMQVGSLQDNPVLVEVAQQAAERLERVAQVLKTGA